MLKDDVSESNHPKKFEFDNIFVELGDFGRYQRYVYVFICLATIIYGQIALGYVFTAGNLSYRCRIDSCDDITNASVEYAPRWLQNAVPYDNGLPSRCHKFPPIRKDKVQCNTSTDFNATESLICDQFVYKTDELTISNAFNLHCDENDWKHTIVGSVNNVALFLCLPIIGILSDRFGRKKIFILGLFSCALVGLLKSFSINYTMFLVLEFVDAGLGSGTFMGAFVLGMELVGPSKRTLGGTVIMCCFTVGNILLGSVAMLTKDFRKILRFSYAPALLVITYFWLIPESSRWLMIVGRKREAANVILRAAQVNRVKLSDTMLKQLHDHCNTVGSERINVGGPADGGSSGIAAICKSRKLLFRTISCCFCWLVNAFVAYGLTVNSVGLAGSKYANFMLISLVEIPAYILTYFIMGRVGRRWSLCGTMLLSGLACLGTLLVEPKIVENTHSGYTIGKLFLYLVGKFAITASFSILYVYTTEIFPTSMRNGLMSTCSMIGRVGSMLAPQTPLLAKYVPSLPLILFSSTAITSGLLVLHYPETFNTKLPDTVEEALQIGGRRRKPII